jgi:GTPase
MPFRSGFVSIIGRPNAGKSTLLNALVGEKIAIVSPKPQTTRNRIQGIVNRAASKGQRAAQIILVDTPGVHKPQTSLNRKMMQEVHAALESQELILLLVDASEKLGAEDRFVLDHPHLRSEEAGAGSASGKNRGSPAGGAALLSRGAAHRPA